MVREFKFFRGYVDKTLTEQWEDIFSQGYPITMPGTGMGIWGTINTPTWVINPNPRHLYTPQPFTITTTPGTGTVTFLNNISGFTTGTSTTSSLITSNPNGITYTTLGLGGLITGTATFSSSSFKLQQNEI